MSEQELPDGPDLATEGYALDELPEGELRGAVYDGRRAVLVRHEGRVYVLEGACTHYSAPLEEGVFDGACIRCPWHHARFDIRTGEQIAPALNPLKRFATEERDGRVFVTGVIEEALAPKDIQATPESVVIIGGGAAGSWAAETLRSEGYEGPVTILSADSYAPYDRPNLSKDYLAGTGGEDWLPLRDDSHYSEKQIEIRTNAKVARIDPATHTLHLESGETMPYGALLLAPGAEPRRLPIEGMDLPHVRVLRDREDCESIIAALSEGGRVAVIGASFIGLEVASSLRQRGYAVTVIAPESQPLEIILGPEVGTRLRRLHEEQGVEFRLGRKPQSITATSVVLDDGSEVEASVVVVGVGVAPRLDLAEAAGLDVDRGIIVDQYLESSVPGIWVAGDVAVWPDPFSGNNLRVEHWVVAQRQGYVAAQNMLGRQTAYTEVPFFWSQQFDLTVTYVGNAAGWDSATVRGSLDDNDALVAYRKDGKILGIATIFRDQDSLRAEIAMERGDLAALEALASG